MEIIRKSNAGFRTRPTFNKVVNKPNKVIILLKKKKILINLSKQLKIYLMQQVKYEKKVLRIGNVILLFLCMD